MCQAIKKKNLIQQNYNSEKTPEDSIIILYLKKISIVFIAYVTSKTFVCWWAKNIAATVSKGFVWHPATPFVFKYTNKKNKNSG